MIKCSPPTVFHHLVPHTQSPEEAKVLDAIDALTECFQLAMGKYPELFTARMMRQEISFGHTPLEKYRGWLLECFHGFNKQLTHCLASDSSQVQVGRVQCVQCHTCMHTHTHTTQHTHIHTTTRIHHNTHTTHTRTHTHLHTHIRTT